VLACRRTVYSLVDHMFDLPSVYFHFREKSYSHLVEVYLIRISILHPHQYA
jgi:hypothetical protein